MSERIESYAHRRGMLALWAGWLLGPLAWAVHLQGSYLLVARVCHTGDTWLLHLLTLLTLALAGAGALIAWRQWQRIGRQWPNGGGVATRSRFLAVAGMLLSGLSGLIILAEGIPNFVLGACP